MCPFGIGHGQTLQWGTRSSSPLSLFEFWVVKEQFCNRMKGMRLACDPCLWQGQQSQGIPFMLASWNPCLLEQHFGWQDCSQPLNVPLCWNSLNSIGPSWLGPHCHPHCTCTLQTLVWSKKLWSIFELLFLLWAVRHLEAFSSRMFDVLSDGQKLTKSKISMLHHSLAINHIHRVQWL
jgi:hypothetical protein